MVCLNAQGFIKHKDEIENVLIGKFRPSIMGFTETHVTNMIEDRELEIKGYVCVREDSKSNRTGGVILYVESTIKFEVIAINTCDSNWWSLTIRVNDKNYKGTLMLFYHSPSGSDAKFIEFLEEICNDDLLNGSVILMGDFNIDMKVKNYCQNKLIRIMNSVGLKQLVNEPTRIVNTSETIIDLVFTNEEIEVTVEHEPRITDHSVIVVYWGVCEKKSESRVIVSRNYKRMDMEKFMRLIDCSVNVIEGNNVNDLANLIINAIVKCLDEVAPRKKITLQSKWRGKQWFSEVIRQMVIRRDEAYKLARISKSNDDWELFRQLRNKVVDECRKAKRNYLESSLDKNKKNPRLMWRSLREMMKGSTSRDNTYREIQCGDTLYSNIEEMANIFNRYFVDSISGTLENNDTMEVIVDKHTESKLEVFSTINVGKLNRIVHRLENKSGTEEGITIEIMKRVVAVAGIKFCEILNRSLEEGIFPNEWKEAIVIPIPKIQRTKKIEEFRPINKLPIYEKVLEIIVHSQLVKYLEGNKLLEECQSGFRAKHSCETALQWVISS